jgi:pimeloyl-ACP methyl ester carboxylesterase
VSPGVARRARLSLVLAIAANGALSCRSPQPQWTEHDGGVTRWIDVPAGRLKTRVYTQPTASGSPVLVLVLHGDLPDPPPSYQYEFAKVIVDKANALTGIVAAGVLRPGYADPTGDRSSGDMGGAVADNYTPEVVDAVARAARELAKEYDAGAIVLVGHSGGAAIAANVLGRHPDVARGAVLVGCGCDPNGWRKRQRSGPATRRSAKPRAASNRWNSQAAWHPESSCGWWSGRMTT